jgi:hypothetical protein
MMFGQAIFSSCFDLLRISLYSYFVLTTNISKSTYHQTVDALLVQISSFLLYANCSKSFYVYTLTSGFFRKIFRNSIYQYYRKTLYILHINQEYDWNTIRLAQKNTNGSALNHELQTIPARRLDKKI